MSQSSRNQSTVNEIVRGGGLVVVAQWEAKPGQADAVLAILHRFLPQAQSDPGVKLFLISQGKDNLQAPWLGLTAFFVIAIMLSLLIFIGEAVRDALDPRKSFG